MNSNYKITNFVRSQRNLTRILGMEVSGVLNLLLEHRSYLVSKGKLKSGEAFYCSGKVMEHKLKIGKKKRARILEVLRVEGLIKTNRTGEHFRFMYTLDDSAIEKLMDTEDDWSLNDPSTGAQMTPLEENTPSEGVAEVVSELQTTPVLEPKGNQYWSPNDPGTELLPDSINKTLYLNSKDKLYHSDFTSDENVEEEVDEGTDRFNNYCDENNKVEKNQDKWEELERIDIEEEKKAEEERALNKKNGTKNVFTNPTLVSKKNIADRSSSTKEEVTLTIEKKEKITIPQLLAELSLRLNTIEKDHQVSDTFKPLTDSLKVNGLTNKFYDNEWVMFFHLLQEYCEARGTYFDKTELAGFKQAVVKLVVG